MKRKKRKTGTALHSAAEHCRQIDLNRQEKIKNVETEIKQLQNQPVTSLLEYRSQQQHLASKQQELKQLREENNQEELTSLLSELETVKAQVEQTVPSALRLNRLYPPSATTKNIFQRMTSRQMQQYQRYRSFQKQYAALSQTPIDARRNNTDTCLKCKNNLIVDKQSGMSICGACSTIQKFPSYILDNIKEADRSKSAQNQSLIHMEKSASEFERGTSKMTVKVAEALALEYGKYHFNDPSKVQSVVTTRVLKTLQNKIPRYYRHSGSRLTRELKAQSIPEFTLEQITQIVNQRNRLSKPNPNEPGKGTFNNTTFLRHLGRTEWENARLYKQTKTVKIHQQRTRKLEQECLQLKQRFGNVKGASWDLAPFS